MTRRKTSTLEKDNEYDDDYDTEDEDDGVNCNSSDTTTEEQLEDYIDWIKRSTETAEGHARRCKVTNWVEGQRARKWALAGHIARRLDGRWSTRAMKWEPTTGSRKVGHPSKRWSDTLVAYCWNVQLAEGGTWWDIAVDRRRWASLQVGFVKTAS